MSSAGLPKEACLIGLARRQECPTSACADTKMSSSPAGCRYCRAAADVRLVFEGNSPVVMTTAFDKTAERILSLAAPQDRF